jgi:hypothetical protein
MTFATHPERQFMQCLRGAGWIKARTLPRSVRTVKSLLQKGWIEKQYQGPNNEAFLRLTEKGLEAKKSPVPQAGSVPQDQLGPFAARAEAEAEIIHLQGHGNIRPKRAVDCHNNEIQDERN